jgi:hypothetical protein
LKKTPKIVELQHNIKQLAMQISKENLLLSIETYQEKAYNLMEEINNINTAKFKHLPKAEKLLNYVKPNLSTRRLFEDIYPSVCNEIRQIIQKLSIKSVQLEQSENHSDIAKNKSCPMEMNTTGVSMRKRKSVAKDVITTKVTKSSTSENTLSFTNNCDNDGIAQTIIPTDDEEFACHTSFSNRNYQQINVSKISVTVLSYDFDSIKIKSNLQDFCRILNRSSLPNYSILTIHQNNQDYKNKIKQKSHLFLGMNKEEIMANSLDLISPEYQFIFELLLTRKNFNIFRDCIETFVTWAEKRNSPYLISIPQSLSSVLKELLNGVECIKVQRDSLIK